MSQGNASNSAEPVPASSSRARCLCQSIPNKPISNLNFEISDRNPPQPNENHAAWLND
jgi:hypothetical protein